MANLNTAGKEPLNLIFGRRSVRVYAPGEVTPGQIQVLLEAAMAAPSAMTKDPWRFVVVRDRQTLGRLPAILPGGGMLPAAAAAIVVCGDLDAAFECQLSYLLQDCSAAIENLLLAAHALGLGACWVGIHPSEKSIGGVRELLGLPPRIVPVAAISLGHPGEELDPRTRFDARYVHQERWQG
ncbi:MAG TPA: nitroreductase family protein [Candidatus Paceibacterota bacterium]|jgi:nitroreductase|nr:nitroreductase family protein [Candidatus Paceibacterota bacterium]